MATQSRKPFLPEDLHHNERPRDVLWRLATAFLKERALKRSIFEFLENDAPATLLFRAASNPAVLGTSGWASQLAATAVYDAIIGLAGPSAAAEIIRQGLQVDFDGRPIIQIPSVILSADDAGGFVAEAAPIPVRKRTIAAGPSLEPFKMAVINEFSNELAKHSNIQRIVTDDLSRAAVLLLDKEMLSTTAASTSRPAGLLNNVVPLTAAPTGADARTTDIRTLVAALAAAGGGVNVVFICAPGQAAVMKDKVGPKFNFPILSSKALAAGSIVALEISNFVSAFGPVPRFEISDSAALQEDTSPLALVDSGVTASPIRSLWQTDTSAVKMILRCSWGMRATGHVQVINSVNW
jgi:hypothetical protein